MKRQPQKRCCLFCGRDTKAVCQTCLRCLGPPRYLSQEEEWMSRTNGTKRTNGTVIAPFTAVMDILIARWEAEYSEDEEREGLEDAVEHCREEG